INRDPLSHLPGWMLQRLLRRDRCEFVQWCLTKGTTGRRQNQPPYFAVFARAQALVDCAMLAVHGNQARAGSRGGVSQQLTSKDHRFLVCQRNRFSGRNRAVSWLESSGTDRGRNNDVDFLSRDNLTQTLFACHKFRDRNAKVRTTSSELFGSRSIRNSNHNRP